MEGTPLVIGFYPGSQLPSIDERYMNNRVPYADEAEVLSVLDFDSRAPYLPVNIAGVDYWFLPDVNLETLVPKLEYLALADHSVTLIKMADMASASLIYRRSPGTGTPEVNTLAQLKIDLDVEPKSDNIQVHIANVTTNPHNVTKTQVGLSNVDNTSDANKPISTAETAALLGKQNNLAYVPEDKGNKVTSISETSTDLQYPSAKLLYNMKAELLATKLPPFSILLSASADVATRISGGYTVTSGGVAVTDWVLSADSIYNLLITHTLTGRKIAFVNVYEIDGANERLIKPFEDAYSGILANGLTVKLEGLDTVALPLRIELIFD